MTAEELEQQATQIANTAHLQFALSFVNFQRQMGAVEALRERAIQERQKTSPPSALAPSPSSPAPEETSGG